MMKNRRNNKNVADYEDILVRKYLEEIHNKQE